MACVLVKESLCGCNSILKALASLAHETRSLARKLVMYLWFVMAQSGFVNHTENWTD